MTDTGSRSVTGPDAGIAMGGFVFGALVGMLVPFGGVFWPLLGAVLIGQIVYIVWRLRRGAGRPPALRRAAFPAGLAIGCAATLVAAFM